ncbi:MAG TPA: hypothetical protein VGS23_06775, partial [Thermoplasmata archaeon]|nr:hypothetical protein [Thermoplasmata archaeon]
MSRHIGPPGEQEVVSGPAHRDRHGPPDPHVVCHPLRARGRRRVPEHPRRPHGEVQQSREENGVLLRELGHQLLRADVTVGPLRIEEDD